MMFLPLNANKYDCIDYAKIVLAIFVIAAHSCLEQAVELDFIRNCLYQLWRDAVPLFFVLSGFLLWRKTKTSLKSEKLSRIKKFINHSLKLYIIWTCIYLPYTIYGFYTDDISITKSIAIFLRNFFLIGENYFSWHLWYMHGMVVAGMILFTLVKCNCKLHIMCVIAITLAIIGQLIDWMNCHDINAKVLDYYYLAFSTIRNGIFVGFPFIMIGVFIAEKGIIRSHIVNMILLLLGICTYVMGQTFFANMIIIFTVVQFLFKIPTSKLEKTLPEKCRLASTVIYFVHMIWIGVLTFIITVDSSLLKFLLTVILSSILAFLADINPNSKLVKVLFK